MQFPDRSRTPQGKGFLSFRPAWERFLVLAVVLLAAWGEAPAQGPSWSMRVAQAVIAGPRVENGGDDWGSDLELEGVGAAWYNTADGDYFRYLRKAVDGYLDAHPDDPQPGPLMARQILLLYRVTLAPKYFVAAEQAQHILLPACTGRGAVLRGGPGFECAAQPFLAEYASVFQRPGDLAELTRSLKDWYAQIGGPAFERSSAGDATLPATHLARLAWSLLESLPNYPEADPGRAELTAMLRHLAEAATRRLNAPGVKSGDQSAECLLVFALEKGVRLGYIPVGFSDPAGQAWGRIVSRIQTDPGGAVRLPSADAQERKADDAAFRGALLLAATEADHTATAGRARGETVLLDAWFNSQQRKNAAGQEESFHYKWSDWSDSGYALLGHLFRGYGARTETLDSAPTLARLAAARFYIIVSPDIPVKNPQPHYMTGHDADQIAAWVRQGGVLALFENDPPNADIDHLNLLADRFGIHFDSVLHHHVLGEHVEDGRIPVVPDGNLFHHPHTLYMKDTCAISVRPPAAALLRDRGDVVMAAVRFGRGTVFAAVDPWVYNEYTDGRKNPLIYNQFDNFAGAEELVQWLLQQRLR